MPRPARKIEGVKFGHVTAMYIVGKDEHENTIWRCKCDCGNEIDYFSSCLRIGRNSHCGCMYKNQFVTRKFKELDSDDKPLNPVRRSRSMLCQPMLSDAFKFFKVLNECRA